MANNKVQLSDGTVLLDLTGDTVTPENLLSGATAHNAAGNRINGAVAPVRYDVAQSLTDEQKAQARTNIGSAPSGFGMNITFWDDTDGSKLKAFLEDKYMTYRDSVIQAKLVDSPICKVAGNGGWADIYFGDDPNSKTITVRYYTVTNYIVGPSVATLMCKNDVWGEWEYENPPMTLGVEYRTTERYLEKPVYCQLVNFGALPNATQKAVKHNIPNVSSVISVYGSAQDQAIVVGAFGARVTGINADNTSVAIWTSADLSNYIAYVAMKYTKTTD